MPTEMLTGTAAAPAELRDATTAFMGGTLFTGMTCSALTAGVMALGSGKIENSRARVLRMIADLAEQSSSGNAPTTASTAAGMHRGR